MEFTLTTDKLIILFLAANPSDTGHLKLDEEARAIDKALRSASLRDSFEMHTFFALRYNDLPEYLLRYSPHIVHFSGHGSHAGEIMLNNERGTHHLVPPKALTNLFATLKDNIRCVVLSACYSDPQARGIAEVIDCVVGLKRAVSDDAARQFACGFYTGLGYGRSVKTAFDLGCNLIAHLGIDQEESPQLISERLDPTSVILARAATTSSPLLSGLFPNSLVPVDASGANAQSVASPVDRAEAERHAGKEDLVVLPPAPPTLPTQGHPKPRQSVPLSPAIDQRVFEAYPEIVAQHTSRKIGDLLIISATVGEPITIQVWGAGGRRRSVHLHVDEVGQINVESWYPPAQEIKTPTSQDVDNWPYKSHSWKFINLTEDEVQSQAGASRRFARTIVSAAWWIWHKAEERNAEYFLVLVVYNS
jgi:hypothetical protein